MNAKSVEERIDALEVAMEGKVDWKWFLTTQITILTVIIGILLAMWGEIRTVREDGQDTKNTVYQINGKLEPFQFLIEEGK